MGFAVALGGVYDEGIVPPVPVGEPVLTLIPVVRVSLGAL